MATRGGVAAALLLVALAMASWSGAASAASLQKRHGPPMVATPGNPRRLPPRSKTIVVKPKFHNRMYEITCLTDWGAYCFIKCPTRCPNKCLAYCAYCLTFCLCDFIPGSSCGDPRFTGGDGNTFYFHGKKDESFCLLSDPGLHINARFVGNHNPDSGRDFTWVQALGVTFGADDGQHRLYIGARKAAEWDEDEDHITITLDGEPVELEAGNRTARWASAAVPGLSVARTDDANAVAVELDGVFAVTAHAVPITDEDSRAHGYGKTPDDTLVHLDVGYKFHGLTADVDGVLGQTYRPNYVTKVDVTAAMPLMGGADRYRSSGLFATDCAVSRFRAAAGGAVTALAS